MTIKGIVKDITHKRFWIEWTNHFKSEADALITPQHEDVLTEVDKLPVRSSQTDLQRALTLWDHVNDTNEYTITDDWQTPAETLSRGKGDCEDYSFLVASMIPHMGFDTNILQVGYMDYPDGRTEEHVWNMADGLLIDATGTPEVVGRMGYRPVKEFELHEI